MNSRRRVNSAVGRPNSMEYKRIEKLFAQLQRQPSHPFPKVGARLEAPPTQGVYIIRNRASKVAHVGRTVRGAKGLSQRLNNHLRGQSSFVNARFAGDGGKLRNGFTFQYLEVSDERERALLENLTIARLCPEHLGL